MPATAAPDSYDTNVTGKTLLFRQRNDPISKCQKQSNTRVLNISMSGKTATKSTAFRHRYCEKHSQGDTAMTLAE
ncbi:MAG: hypothetical protein PUB74_00585, partial [Bifidobacterium boum]|nr:hypothetical protein [Bifidobacterium boum]